MKNTLFAIALLVSSSNLSADTIRPKGDENLGSLVVQEPRWGSPAETNILPYSIVTGIGTVRNGVSNRVLEGNHKLQLRTDGFLNIDYADVKVTKKTTTTVKLSGLVAGFDTGTKSTTQVDLGPRAKLLVLRSGVSLNVSYNSPFWTGKNERGMVVLPGKYAFSWGIPAIDKIEKEILPGEVARIDLTPADRRGTILVVPAARKEFGSPVGSSCYTYANKLYLEHRELKNSNPETVTLADLSTRKEFKAYQSTGEYRINLNGLVETVKVESGRTTEIALRRIDVDHVEVTNEQGQTNLVNGTYRVEQRQADGNWKHTTSTSNTSSNSSCNSLSQYPTQSGLDVPRGEYRVTINYQTAEGAKTDVHLLDLR